MKKRLPAIITILLILGALALFAYRQGRLRLPETQKSVAVPEDVIWRMSDASRNGDAQAYLNCFDGALRQNLEKTVAEMGEQKFGDYLKRLNDEITGIAVSDLELTGETEAKLRVEFVFRGKSETQWHHLKLSAGTWKIDRMDEAERNQSGTRYLTPVF